MAWAIVAAVLAFFTLLPVAGMAVAWGYFAYRTAKGFKPPQPLPEIAVLLPLRGADPSLEACLKGLLAQDYPTYQVHIVIDSAEDPAQAVVARVLAEAGPAQGRRARRDPPASRHRLQRQDERAAAGAHGAR